MMLEQAMLRHWWDEWMEEVNEGIEETEEGYRKKIHDIQIQSRRVGSAIGEGMRIVNEEIDSLSKRSGAELIESKNRITKEIVKMESKVTSRLEDLDRKMKDKKRIEI
jgi:hypothetical protein